MNTNVGFIKSALMFAILLAALTSCAGSPTVPGKRLVGKWHGQDRFSGMSYEEVTKKKVKIQDVETLVIIAPDGKVTGHVGGAEFVGCAVTANRGWFGRLLHIKTDFIIIGEITGAAVPGSEGGTHSINAPFNLTDSSITGSVFVIRTFTYPYPFLKLRLNH